MIPVSSSSLYLLPFCFPVAAISSRSISGEKPFKVENRPKFGPFVVREFSRLIGNAGEPKWSLYQQGYETWEEPDSGSDSECEEMNEKTELDFKNDCIQGTNDGESFLSRNTFRSNIVEEQLIEEVEQLLSTEEKLILHFNPHSNVGKISSPKWKPLHTLTLSGQMAFLDMLLDQGLDIDESDKDGQTPLHRAILGNKEAVISHLVRKRANLDARDRDGATPLHYATHVGAIQTVKLLIKFHADVNLADNEGWTPLHVAVQSRNRDIIKFLLINGADKTIKNKEGRTPLDICLAYGRDFNSYDIAKLLKLVPAARDQPLN